MQERRICLVTMGIRIDMHDLFGSSHMLWGLQLLLGVTWSVVLQNSLAPQPLHSMTQHLTDDTHQRNLT